MRIGYRQTESLKLKGQETPEIALQQQFIFNWICIQLKLFNVTQLNEVCRCRKFSFIEILSKEQAI